RMSPKPRVELEDELIAPVLMLVEPGVAQNVRCSDDGVHSVGCGSAAERNRLIPVSRTIIDAGKAMEVDFNQRESSTRNHARRLRVRFLVSVTFAVIRVVPAVS